jgi:FixJ family two-component response regulator
MSVQATKAGAMECLTKPVRDQHGLDTMGQAIACDVWPAGSVWIWRSYAVVMTR